LKIYGEDANLPYKTAWLRVLNAKSIIDGLLIKWVSKIF